MTYYLLISAQCGENYLLIVNYFFIIWCPLQVASPKDKVTVKKEDGLDYTQIGYFLHYVLFLSYYDEEQLHRNTCRNVTSYRLI